MGEQVLLYVIIVKNIFNKTVLEHMFKRRNLRAYIIVSHK